MLIIVIIIAVKNKKEQREVFEQKNSKEIVIETKQDYDEETGLYYITDENTGEIIGASRDENDLEFYKKHPDYNPNPLSNRSTNIQDFVDYD